MQDSIEKKIEKYVEEGKSLKKEFENVISNRDLSLDYRWRLFSNVPGSLKNHESWLHQFSAELILPEKEILWMDTFYYDRYTTIDTTAWIDRLDGKKGWTDDIVNTFKEEILAENLGSFVNDW